MEITNTDKAQDMIESALKKDSPQIAFQKALMGLSPKERSAVNLLRSGAASSRGDALRKAGYSATTVKNQKKFFGKAKIMACLELGEQAEAPVQEITSDTFLADLVELASANPIDALGEDGRALPPKDWPKGLQRMVKKISFNVMGGVEEVTFESRSAIQQMVGRHRNVKAFEQKTIERRVFVVRDYTGRTDLHGKEIEGASEPRFSKFIDVAGKRVEVGEGQSLPGQIDRSKLSPKARAHLDSFDEVADIDRGNIPVRGESDGFGDAVSAQRRDDAADSVPESDGDP